jgi:hypothetical protein
MDNIDIVHLFGQDIADDLSSASDATTGETATPNATAVACADTPDIRLSGLVDALRRADEVPTEEEIKVWAAVGRDGSARATAAWLLLGKAAFECTGLYGGIEKAQARVTELTGYGRSHVQQARQVWEHVVENHDGQVPAEWLAMSQGEVKDLVQPYRRRAPSARAADKGFTKSLEVLIRRATTAGANAKELACRLRAVADALDADPATLACPQPSDVTP